MPNSNTRKLNDTQLVILSSASQREDGFAVLPEGVRAASGKAAVIRLTKLGFLKQVRVKRDQPHWFGRGGQADRAKDHQRRLGRDWRRRRRQGRGGARAGAEAPVQEGRRAGRGSARGRRASPRVEARTDHRPDAGHGGGYPQRHGRGDRLAPAHHPGRSDGPAPQGLCHRERQERQSRDGVPDRRCRRGHVEHRRRGARVRARIIGQALERELGRLANGSGSGLGPRTANRTVAFPATSSSTHVEAELIRLACADTNGLARRWRVLFGGRAPELPRALLLRILAEDHAILIRRLFTSYLELGSVSALKCRLDAAGRHVPERVDGAGRRCGGKPFSRGHLYKILSNPIYIGQLSHRGKTYDGQHPAIVEQATWDNAQARLASHAHRRACRQLASAHLLMGRIQDDRGHAMTPTHAQKGSRRYRYYVSQAVLQGKPERGSIARVPAPEIEALVISAMRSATPTNPELSDAI